MVNICVLLLESPMAVDFNSSCEEDSEMTKSSSKENEIINIDCGSDVNDILDVAEYADEIYDYLKRAEVSWNLFD